MTSNVDKKDKIDYDDKFYDLDDGWICDEDIGDGQEDVGFSEFMTE